MSLPKPLNTQEILEKVKNILLEQNNNIEILEQSQFTSKMSFLPSLKTESFILYKNLQNNSLNIAKTENLDIIQILNIEEFKEALNKIPSYEQKKLENILHKIDSENKLKFGL